MAAALRLASQSKGQQGTYHDMDMKRKYKILIILVHLNLLNSNIKIRTDNTPNETVYFP